jgi:broad specificity phosphatase PhoE
LTTCFLVRHGRTRANIDGIFAGHSDDPLLPEGRDQAARAAELLLGRGVSRIYSSPVARAWETASIMGNVLNAGVVRDDALTDIDIPAWEGERKDILMAEPGSGYQLWKKAPDSFVPDNGESLYDVQKRSVKRVKELFEHHSGDCFAVVTHLAVARCLVLGLEPSPLSMYRNIKISNGEPIEIVYNNAHFTVNLR